MLRYIVVSSFVVVLFTSTFALIFAFSNYTVTLSASRYTFDNIRELIGFEQSARLHQKNNPKDSTSGSNIEKINRILDRLESTKDASFDGNTLTFLYTVFSILFVSVGFYLYNRTDERLDEIKKNLKIQYWVSINTSFFSYLSSLETISAKTRNDDNSIINTIADTRLYLGLIEEQFNKMKSNRTGMDQEQRSLFLQLSDSLDGLYETIILCLRNNNLSEGYVREFLKFQKRIRDMHKSFKKEPFVERWNKASHGKDE